jgi:alcohol dehydrogenase class IV
MGLCAACESLDSGVFLALVMAGYCTTIASSCVGVAILHHMPGGTLDISHAICAAVVGYTVINFWALLIAICLVIKLIFCCEFTLHLFLQ